MTPSYVAKTEARKPPRLSLVAYDARSPAPTRLDEEPLSDCWPDWSTAVCDQDEIRRSAERNSPGKVLFEVGLVLTAAALLVILVTLFVPPP